MRLPRRLVAFACALAVLVAVPVAHAAPSVDRQLGAAVLAELNEVRVAAGLAPLRESDALAGAARRHAIAMAVGGYFSHASSRLIQASYRPGQASAVGEVMYWWTGRAGARHVVSRWLASVQHRRDVLGRWRDAGVAAVRAPHAPGYFGGRSVTLVVVDLGRPR